MKTATIVLIGCAMFISVLARAQKELPATGIKITVLDAAGTTLAQSITDRHGSTPPMIKVQMPKAALCNIRVCCFDGPEFYKKRKLAEEQLQQKNSGSQSAGSTATGDFTPIKVMCSIGGKTYTAKVSSPTDAATFQVPADKIKDKEVILTYQLDLTIR